MFSSTPSRGSFYLVIADRDSVAAEATRASLRLSLDARIDIAPDGATALALATAHLPDAVLADLDIKGIDALALAAALRSAPALRPPYLVALAGSRRGVNDLDALESAFDRVLAKPLDVDELLSSLGAVAGREAPSPLAQPQVTGQPVSFLVVDDDDVNRLVSQAIGESLGYRVVTANDGLDAIDQCRRWPPQVILMDVNMRVLSGPEAAGRLRLMQVRGLLPPLAIVGTSTDQSAEVMSACTAAGMDAFLPKPFDAALLRTHVDRLLAAS